jgi:peptide/nickel transport system substrate-binding protein
MNPLLRLVFRRSRLLAAAVVASISFVSPVANAQTFKFANQGDALSMDPHSLNESFQLNFTGNIYEPLIGRGKKLELVPALATDWKQTAPTVWRFNLRKGVVFHDGTQRKYVRSMTMRSTSSPASRSRSWRT